MHSLLLKSDWLGSTTSAAWLNQVKFDIREDLTRALFMA